MRRCELGGCLSGCLWGWAGAPGLVWGSSWPQGWYVVQQLAPGLVCGAAAGLGLVCRAAAGPRSCAGRLLLLELQATRVAGAQRFPSAGLVGAGGWVLVGTDLIGATPFPGPARRWARVGSSPTATRLPPSSPPAVGRMRRRLLWMWRGESLSRVGVMVDSRRRAWGVVLVGVD